MNSNCSNFSDVRNIQDQVKKAFCYQKLFWPFTVWINCSNCSDSWPSASNSKSFPRSHKQYFLTVGQNHFGKKTPSLNEGIGRWQKLCSFLQNWYSTTKSFQTKGNLDKCYAPFCTKSAKFGFGLELKIRETFWWAAHKISRTQ